MAGALRRLFGPRTRIRATRFTAGAARSPEATIPGGDDIPGGYSPDGKRLVFVRAECASHFGALCQANLEALLPSGARQPPPRSTRTRRRGTRSREPSTHPPRHGPTHRSGVIRDEAPRSAPTG